MTDFLSQLIKRRETEVPGPGAFGQKNSDASGQPPAEEPVRSTEMDDPNGYILRLGLFSAEFYLSSYPDIAAADMNPFEHFFHYGFQEGRCPNPYFDPLWYLDNNPDVQEVQTQPLLHYALYGDREGRRPSIKFDTTWYRRTYNIPPQECALRIT